MAARLADGLRSIDCDAARRVDAEAKKRGVKTRELVEAVGSGTYYRILGKKRGEPLEPFAVVERKNAEAFAKVCGVPVVAILLSGIGLDPPPRREDPGHGNTPIEPSHRQSALPTQNETPPQEVTNKALQEVRSQKAKLQRFLFTGGSIFDKIIRAKNDDEVDNCNSEATQWLHDVSIWLMENFGGKLQTQFLDLRGMRTYISGAQLVISTDHHNLVINMRRYLENLQAIIAYEFRSV
jgi:hypothetical protein